MKPLLIYVDPATDRSKAFGLFSQLERVIAGEQRFVLKEDPSQAHIAIMNDDGEKIPGNPKGLLRASLYSSHASNFGARLICPDDLMSRLFEYSQILNRDQILPRED